MKDLAIFNIVFQWFYCGVELMGLDVEDIVRRVVETTRIEELKIIAEAVKSLADYMKGGFENVNKRLGEIFQTLQEHTRILEEHSRILGEHSKAVARLAEEIGGLKVVIGGFTSRSGMHMEKMVLNLLKKTLLELKGIDVEKIEKKSFVDNDGVLLQPGQKIDIDVYMSDKQVYAIEVKSLFENEDVDWLIAKRKFLEKAYGLQAVWLIVASAITDEAYRKALENKIEVVYGTLIPT